MSVSELFHCDLSVMAVISQKIPCNSSHAILSLGKQINYLFSYLLNYFRFSNIPVIALAVARQTERARRKNKNLFASSWL